MKTKEPSVCPPALRRTGGLSLQIEGRLRGRFLLSATTEEPSSCLPDQERSARTVRPSTPKLFLSRYNKTKEPSPCLRRNAFYGCRTLKKIEIPEAVTVIKDGAFKRCDSVTSIVFNEAQNTLQFIGAEAFYTVKVNLKTSVLRYHRNNECIYNYDWVADSRDVSFVDAQ